MTILFNYLGQTIFEPEIDTGVHTDRGVFKWKQIFADVDELVSCLKSLGIAKTDRIIIELDTGLDFIITLLATIKMSLVVIPVSPQVPKSEFEKIRDTVKPKFIISSQANSRAGERYLDFEPVSEFNKVRQWDLVVYGSNYYHRPKSNLCLDQILNKGAFIRFTSGTTGNAKGVVISFDKALERVQVTKRNFSLTSSDCVLNLLPLPCHFIAMLLSIISSGADLILCKSVEETSSLNMPKKTISLIYGAPFHFDYLCGLDSLNLKEVRLALSTSIGLEEKTFDNFLRLYDVPICQSYGVIEVGIPCANISARGTFDSIGRAFQDFEAVLVTSSDADDGIFAVSGPGLFDAYLEPFIAAEEVLLNGKFLTGDRVRLENGEYKVVGRSNSVINVGGFKVFPEEVEKVLMQIPVVKEVQIVGVPHPIFGNILKANIVLNPGSTITKKELKRFCGKNLHAAQIPLDFEIKEVLNKNSAGKLFRKYEV